MTSIVGVCTSHKPFPTLIAENERLFEGCRTFLDIGAGDGRMAAWFASYDDVEEYVAVEPCLKLLHKLVATLRGWRPLRTVAARWEDVRWRLIQRRFDVLIVWDVAMFMDLSEVHGLNPLDSLLREIDVWCEMTEGYLLFSLHPCKNAVIPSQLFPKIFERLDSRMRLVGKRYLNRIYASRR